MKKNFLFFCVIFVAFFRISQGLRCYTCSYDDKHSDSDINCVTAPWNLTVNSIRTCQPHFKFCIIIRIEAKDTGKVTSFLRKCEENPMEDSDVDSTFVVSHYRSCSTDLCNKGDGLNFIDEGHDGDSVALLVPDTTSSSPITTPHTCFLFISLFPSFIFVFIRPII